MNKNKSMLKQEDGGGNNWARVCDTCRSAASTVYCRADSAFLCTGCDSRIHAANKVASRHHRVWVCESCERVPAAFLCKADAASLCTTCDADIHSSNPLARRHHRVPILPIPGTLYGPPATDPCGPIIGAAAEDDGFRAQDVDETIDETDEDEAASWLLFNPPVKTQSNHKINGNGMLFGGGEVVDEYLDLVEYRSCQENHEYAGDDELLHHQHDNQQEHYAKGGCRGGGDSVVPVRPGGGGIVGKDQLHLHQQQQHHHNESFQLGLEYEASNNGYAYPASLSHSVSISSIDCGVVPESTMTDISISHHRPPKRTIDLFASSTPIQMPHQLTPMDREARVLRYREKKKTRKFEKTIRYASRKAYAETRPRIKGRFAKRTDAEVEVDQMLSTELIVEGGYGIVPTF